MVQALQSFLIDPRRAGWRVLILLAAALLCFAGAAWAWQQARTWPERALLPLDDPLANLNQVGVNADLAQYSPAELDAVLAHIAGGGFSWVRQRFGWDQIEAQQGAYDWATWDGIVAACARHDLRLIAVLDGTPPWARPNGEADPRAATPPAATTPPGEVAEWGAFVARVAARYRGQVAAYQLWDEPNLAAHWGGRYVDPPAYAALLREGAIQVRDADPGAAVLLAALAPTVERGPLNLNEIEYLSGLVDAGARPYFDVVALQPYGFAFPPEAAPSNPGELRFGRAAHVRRAMVRMGLGDCPVWATAWGWNALPPGTTGEAGSRPANPWPVVDAERQAAYTVEALEIARREWPWMGPMILYHYRPDRPLDDPRWGFALVRPEGESGLLYEELARYNAAPQPHHVGVYVPRPDHAQYSAPDGGAWRFSEAGADPPRGADAAQRNAVLAFDVVGAALDLTVRRGDYWGVLYVTVDGRPANGLPRDEEGRSYLALYDPAGRVETVGVARSLAPDRPHSVEIVAHGGWGQWPLAGWTVHGPVPRHRAAQAPSPGGASFLILAGLAALAAAGGQVVLNPGLHRPLYAALGRLFRRYRALPEPIPVLATLGAALGFYAVPWTSLALPLLALWVALAFLRIDLGLATVALALPFYLRPKVLLGRPFSVVELGLAGCVVAWGAARVLDWGRRTKDEGRRRTEDGRPWVYRLAEWQRKVLGWLARPRRIAGWTALDAGMVAWVGVALLSVEGAAPRQLAWREWRTVFLESAMFYALIRLAVRSPRARQRLVEGWLLGAALAAGIGVWQALAGRDLITAEGVWRVRGWYGSPNNLALYLGRALPVLLAVAWQGFGKHAAYAARAMRTERTWRLVYGGAALLTLAALLLTFSKGALLLGLPAALLALGLFQRNRRATWVALGALGVLALLLAPLVLSGRFGSLLDLTRGTGFFRLKLWRSTLNMIADRPLAGVGLDGFLYAYRSRYVLPSAWEELNLSHPHNLLLDAWTRLGLLGVGVVGWLLVSFYRAAWRAYRGATGYERALLLGMLAAMASVVAHGLVDQALFTIDLAMVFGLVLSATPRDPGRQEPGRTEGWRYNGPRF